MAISLIIPAYNEEKWIVRCLDSVERYAKGRFADVIVVDNASSDRTAEVARRFSGVRVVRENTKGLTHARQAGLEAVTSDYVAYIDADCLLTSQWIDIAEATLRAGDVVALK